jgi:hypothetical protein
MTMRTKFVAEGGSSFHLVTKLTCSRDFCVLRNTVRAKRMELIPLLIQNGQKGWYTGDKEHKHMPNSIGE